MKKLKVGVVGIGGIARNNHLLAWNNNQHVEIVALCDIVKEKAFLEAEKYGIDKDKVFKDYHDLIDLDEVDIVDICTPNYLHSIIAVAAFEKGKYVFSEKPDAVNVEEVLKMKEASEKAEKMLMVMRNNRFLNMSQFLKDYIEQGKMGEIYAAKCGWMRSRGIPGKGGWFTTKAQSGGGPLIDLGVHMIDLAIWLMGNPTPVSVVGSTYSKFADSETNSNSKHATFGEEKEKGIYDVEDLAMGFIKFDNGACLTIEFSWASNIERGDRFVELMGTKAGSKWHSHDDQLKIFGEVNGSTYTLVPDISDDRESPHARNINHFVDCILNNAEPIFTPQQGVDMIKILTAIYKSAETGKEVVL